MSDRLAHRGGRSSQATPAAVDKSLSASHTKNLTPPSRATGSSTARNAATQQVLVDTVVDLGSTSWIRNFTFRDIDSHPLPRSRQAHSVGVLNKNLSICRIYMLPSRTSKAEALPLSLIATKVGIPTHTSPIEFEPLNVELGRSLFKVVRRANICSVIQEPKRRINLRPNPNSVRTQPTRARRRG